MTPVADRRPRLAPLLSMIVALAFHSNGRSGNGPDLVEECVERFLKPDKQFQDFRT
jgi:hypothetical protein